MSRNLAAILIAVVLIGFVVGSGSIDIESVSQGAIQSQSFALKYIRILTIGLAGLSAVLIAGHSKTLGFVAFGNSKYIVLYVVASMPSLFVSPYPAMSIFKLGEVAAMVIIGTLVYKSPDPRESSRSLIVFLMWWYAVTVIAIWVEFKVFGMEHQRLLVQDTPYISFMLTSVYPGLVGNAVGFISAVAALFSTHCLLRNNVSLVRKGLIFILFLLPAVAGLIFSYTRSALIFFFIACLLLLLFHRRYLTVTAMIFACLLSLGLPPVQEKLLLHLKRGNDVTELANMSGRTTFWVHILERGTVPMILGDGFATGFIEYLPDRPSISTGARQVLTGMNAHNSTFEVLASSGVVPSILWTFLMIKLLLAYIRIRSNSHCTKTNEDKTFHDFLLSLVIFSFLRSMMNSTFVYVDYFYPLLIALCRYSDILLLAEEPAKKPVETLKATIQQTPMVGISPIPGKYI